MKKKKQLFSFYKDKTQCNFVAIGCSDVGATMETNNKTSTHIATDTLIHQHTQTHRHGEVVPSVDLFNSITLLFLCIHQKKKKFFFELKKCYVDR